MGQVQAVKEILKLKFGLPNYATILERKNQNKQHMSPKFRCHMIGKSLILRETHHHQFPTLPSLSNMFLNRGLLRLGFV